MAKETIKIVDSHTGGEPTRVVTGGFPDLGAGSVSDRLTKMRSDFDHLRSGIVNEPRGFPAIVGALLCESDTDDSDSGVIFFNNTGYLQMCGHGTIGVVKTLDYLGRLESEKVRIDTVAGTVEATLNDDGSVSLENVESYRFQKDAKVDVPGHGFVTGDIAWGGNWFFLIKEHGLKISMANLSGLESFSATVMQALHDQGITGRDGAEIDHVELFSASLKGDSRNFVLCPGGEYDRSPCGTGTSAKLACLAADGILKEGEKWLQESVTGSLFEGVYRSTANGIIPTITGSAHITAETILVFSEEDPFRYGIS